MLTKNFYRAFEERYYAPREIIKKLRKQYLPFIEPLKKVYPKGNTFDFGCGRGEWLELMKKAGFNPFGVDLDDGMLEACHELNLAVSQGNAIEYIQTLNDASQIVITAFHVVEHISFADLQIFIQESLRVLKPGGLLIMETPNPENIRVATRDFYQDPTHIKPIPLTFLSFITEYIGFKKVKTLRLQENSELLKKQNINLLDILEGVSPDYAIIAQKNAENNILKLFNEPFSKNYGLTLNVLADKFENRLHLIEQKASQAEAKADEYANLYHSVVNSNSWKITKPLRELRKFLHWFTLGSYHWLTFSHTSRPRRFIVPKIRKLVNTNPQLKSIILQLMPHKYITKLSYQKETGKFKKFIIDDTLIHFSLAPLEDTRGIGRVTSEQFKYFEKNLDKYIRQKYKKEIFFYSSIHWCPDTLEKNTVIMIHDVTPLVLKEHFEDASIIWETKFKKIAHQAKYIITISENSKKDIHQYLGIEKSKIFVVPNGVTSLPVAKNIKYDLPKKYFVYLGAYDHHKNLDIILKAISLDKKNDLKLILIGNNYECKNIIKKYNIEEKVIFLGKLEDNEVGYVLQNAIALVFPSLYEGFGLPPMEAGLLKVPSICSNRPTMTEFLENVVLFADPYDAKQWLTQMEKLLDATYKKNYGVAIFKRVSQFTWESSCKQLVKILKNKNI